MTLDEMREELLSQHAAIKEIVTAALLAARAAEDGREAAAEDLRIVIGRLQVALVSHNAREEDLLRDVIRHVDAWGDVREALLGEHHANEHTRMTEALERSAAGAPSQAHEVLALLESILDHMRDEEDKILAARVLTDALSGIDDGFGG